MRSYSVIGAILASVLCGVGCNQAEVQNLADQVQALEAKVKQLEAENTALKEQLSVAAVETAKYEEIRKGYEAARVKFTQSMAKLAPILGLTASPLPAFEELKDSSWVSKFAPSEEVSDLTKGLQALQGELKGLLGEPGGNPEKPKE